MDLDGGVIYNLWRLKGWALKSRLFWAGVAATVHPQNVRFQNVRFQNVWFQNVRFQNVSFAKRQVYKTSGFKTSGFKTSGFKTSIEIKASIQPVFKFYIVIKQKV